MKYCQQCGIRTGTKAWYCEDCQPKIDQQHKAQIQQYNQQYYQQHKRRQTDAD